MTDILWKGTNCSLRSSDLFDRSLQTCFKNVLSTLLIEPNVSIATGMNMWKDDRADYLANFLFTAAALPPLAELADRYDWAKVSTTVVSHAREWPSCHGIRVRPGFRPDGSLSADISAHLRVCQITLFNCWWCVERPAQHFQDSSCSSLSSTTLSHGQG